MKNLKRYIQVLFFVILVPTLSCKDKPEPHANGDVLVLTGAKIFPDPVSVPIVDGVVIVREGKIAAVGKKDELSIPKGAKVLDCKGLFMTAGFWNSHIHFIEPKWQNVDSIPAQKLTGQLQEMLTQYGFTYVFDVSNLDLKNVLTLKRRINSGEVQGPHIFTTGSPFTPPNGSPFYVEPLQLPEMESPEQAANHVKNQIEMGADGTKMWSASPDGEKIVYMPIEIGKAGVDMAHQLGKPVFAHPSNNEGVQTAIDCGVDILTHVSPDDRKTWDPEMIEAMIQGNMAVIPTLKLYKWDLERFGIEPENHPLIQTAVQQASDFSKAGGEILFGMDTGYMNDYGTLEELQLMQLAGMDFVKILASMTTAPAKRFGYGEQTGKIHEGMDADIVLLSHDPSADVTALSKVVHTLKSGKIIYSKSTE